MPYRVSPSSITITRQVFRLVTRVLRRSAIGQSEFVARFEERLRAFTGAKHCIATASGTLADTILVAAARQMFPNRPFVVPALTFAAHANSVIHNRARLVFADVRE